MRTKVHVSSPVSLRVAAEGERTTHGGAHLGYERLTGAGRPAGDEPHTVDDQYDFERREERSDEVVMVVGLHARLPPRPPPGGRSTFLPRDRECLARCREWADETTRIRGPPGRAFG